MEHLRLSSFCNEASEQRDRKKKYKDKEDIQKTKAAILVGTVGFFSCYCYTPMV